MKRNVFPARHFSFTFFPFCVSAVFEKDKLYVQLGKYGERRYLNPVFNKKFKTGKRKVLEYGKIIL